ncbi:MAG: rhomboid family intramembrane serine protease [Candidatus Zixiibacteriota bacterium]
MRYTLGQSGWGGGYGGGGLPPAIKLLLIANGGLFLLQTAFYAPMVQYLGLTPTMFWKGAAWQIVTYMFLHGGFFHILFNMFALWMFGRDLEFAWGSRQFLKYYLVCGIGAGITTALLLPNQAIPTIGASGAVFGILLAFGMMFPNRTIYLWFFLPIPAKYMVILFGVIELFAASQGTGSGIAHWTHLGGLAIGFLYLRFGGRRLRFRLPNPFGFIARWRGRRKAKKLRKKWDDQRDLMDSVDRVLDRINEVGYENLTDEEKEVLEKAARKLSLGKDRKGVS